MSQFLKYASLVVAAFVAMTVPAMAQDGAGAPVVLTTIGAGIVVVGAGLGISKLQLPAC